MGAISAGRLWPLLALAVIAAALAVYSGAYVIAPALGAAVAWVVLDSRGRADRRVGAPVTAWNIGFLVWILFDALQWIANLILHSFDVLALGLLAPWLYLRRSLWAAWLLIAYQLIGVWWDIRMLEGDPGDEHWVSQQGIVRLVWRIFALALLMAFIWRRLGDVPRARSGPSR